MTTTNEPIHIKSEPTPFGKVMGIVHTSAELRAISQALSKLGVPNVEGFDGTVGLNAMNGEQHAVAQCFLGDMESKTVQRFQDALSQGNIIFSATVEPQLADKAAEAAKANGALEVVHMGTWVITNY